MTALIFKIGLILHVLAGSLALVFGLVAMVVRKKGGKVHNISGLIFYYGMMTVFLSTFLFVIKDPLMIKYHFFLGLNFVAFYPAYSGKRILKMKKGITPSLIDWAAAFILLVMGLVMCIYPSFFPSDLSVLFYVFGITGLINGFTDLALFFGIRKASKQHWLLAHIGKMLGAYSAAVTAFAVNVIPQHLPQSTPQIIFLVLWIGPGVALGVLSIFQIRKYKNPARKLHKNEIHANEVPAALLTSEF